MTHQDPKHRTIEIRIHLPSKFSIPYVPSIIRRFQALPYKKKRLAITISGLVVLIGVGTAAISHFSRTYAQQKKAAEITQSKKYTGTQLTAPDYSTLLPGGKTIDSLGGWTRVSPPEKNPVFAFADLINNKKIIVSEQPLPPEFKDDSGGQDESQVAQLAQGYKATDKITVGETIVYIGNSAKGPQSVIFGKNNLLILIKTSVPVSDDEWAGYVNTLR